LVLEAGQVRVQFLLGEMSLGVETHVPILLNMSRGDALGQVSSPRFEFLGIVTGIELLADAFQNLPWIRHEAPQVGPHQLL
jgi:hypothetical protein